MVFRPALAGLVLAIVLTTTAHAQAPSQSSDEAQVRTVVTAYRDAVARLDVSQTPDLFWQDSEVFESGGAEGTFARYLEHHIGPEFADLASFTFSEPQADVEIDGDIALVTETYRYRITFKDAARAPVERQGVATSVLRKRDGVWRFSLYHSSARPVRPAS